MGIAAETWIVIGLLALVTLITVGAIRPMISADKKRRSAKEQKDD